MHAAGHQDFLAAQSVAAQHCRLSNSRAAVVHGSVGYGHAGNLADQALVFPQGLQITLGNFGLVLGISRIKFAAAQDKIYRAGNKMVVGTGA
jgi:hypothetical protein